MNDFTLTGKFCHLKQFEDLLYDSVMLSYMAHDIDIDKDEHGYLFPLIRASIIQSIILLECGANYCIGSLALAGRFFDDIDKLPYISKYEFFLSVVKPDKKFDRGCIEIQQVKELKSIRDSYVHPKIKKEKYFEIGESAWDTDFGKTKMLQIPRAPKDWRPEHTIVVHKAVNEFFNKFFLDLCEFDKDTICAILLSENEVVIPRSIGKTGNCTIDAIDLLNRAVLEWGIDFKYIEKKL